MSECLLHLLSDFEVLYKKNTFKHKNKFSKLESFYETFTTAECAITAHLTNALPDETVTL